MKRVVVIGGGISGLSTAHRLAELGRERRLPLEITLLEAQDRFGGVIDTQVRDGLLLEGGPDAFVAEKPWALDLCHRLGIGNDIMETRPGSRRSFILHRGTLAPIPEGFYLVAPARLATVFRMPVLSWRGKVRMACEPFVPPRKDARDESVGSFVRRRFGRETLARIGQPMIAGIYAADPDRLSLQATMPRLAEMERRYGSVIQALRASAREPTDATRSASGPRYSLFLTLRDGMRALVDALIAKMPDVSLRRRASVAQVEPPGQARGTELHPPWGATSRTPGRVQGRLCGVEVGSAWRVILQDGQSLEAEGLCLALPADRAASLLGSCAPDLAEQLAGIPYESVATVNLAFRSVDVPQPLSGFGLVVPALEGRRIIGCTFASVKFSGRAPETSVLLRAFVGGALQRDVFALDDAAMERMVREELRDVLGIRAAPSLISIHRHRLAMPQYRVGHLLRVAAIESMVHRSPGLYLTGNGFRGIGLPDCIRQAEITAERMVAELAQAGSGASRV